MTEMIVVEDRNQDDMSRKAGCYLYTDTRLYIRGKDVTRDVNTFFFQNKWPARRGLDTAEKITLFRVQFLK